MKNILQTEQERFLKEFPTYLKGQKRFLRESHKRVLEQVREYAKERGYNHGQLHGSIDCEPCAYSDISSFISKLLEE